MRPDFKSLIEIKVEHRWAKKNRLAHAEDSFKKGKAKQKPYLKV